MAADDDSNLLRSYSESGAEEAFQVIVTRYAGLALGGAIRRTGNRQMAEEITQNVLAILARKAPSLVRHPSLPGWVHRTTMLECSKALRGEARHHKKMDDYSQHLASLATRSQGDEARWGEIMPHVDLALNRLSESDRRVILLRYFERKSYADIATAFGKSESACRMQSSRAVGRLSRLLKRAGVTLPAAALGGALAVGLGEAASAAVCRALCKGAIADAQTVPALTLITNTLQTMAYAKTKAVAALGLAAMLIPIGATSMERKSLEQRVASLAGGSIRSNGSPLSALPARAGVPGDSPRPETAAELARRMVGTSIDGYALADHNALQRISRQLDEFDGGRLEELLAAIDDLPQEGRPVWKLKEVVLQKLTEFAPETVARYGLENGFHQHASAALRKWGETDRDAALALLGDLRAAGKLASRGLLGGADSSMMGASGFSTFHHSDAPPEAKKLISLESFYYGSLFNGVAAEGLEPAIEMAKSLDGDALFGALTGLGSHFRHGDLHAEYGQLVAEQLDDPAQRLSAIGIYGDVLEMSLDYNKILSEMEELVGGARLGAAAANDVLFEVAAKAVADSELESAVAWVVDSSDSNFREQNLSALINAWARGEFHLVAKWLGDGNGSPDLEQAIHHWATDPALRTEGVTRQAANALVGSISDESLRETALAATATGQYSDEVVEIPPDGRRFGSGRTISISLPSGAAGGVVRTISTPHAEASVTLTITKGRSGAPKSDD